LRQLLEENILKRFWRENWLVILVIAAMMVGYLLLRTPGDQLVSTAEFDAQVSNGTPTLVEFYSNT
jgi:uncharacterized protein HemY